MILILEALTDQFTCVHPSKVIDNPIIKREGKTRVTFVEEDAGIDRPLVPRTRKRVPPE